MVTDELLDAIYDPGLRAGQWRPALACLRGMLGSAEIALTVVARAGPRPELWQTTGAVLTSRECEDYEREFWQLDPKMPLLADRGPGFVFNDVEHFDHDFVAKSPFYQQYSLKLGIRHTLDLFADSYEGGDVYIAAMRTPKQRPFDATSVATLRTAAGHFVRALKARGEIARAEKAAKRAEAALEGLDFGIAVVDAAGTIVFANAFARAAFEENRCIDPGRAHPADSPLPRRLREAIRGRPSHFNLRNGEDWLVSAAPLSGEAPLAPGSTAAALLVYRRAAQTIVPAASQLKVMYSLTSAEAEVALGIAGGKSLAAIARERDVKLSTVRWQLLAVLRKLGVRRQSDVVRVLTAAASRDC